MSVPPVRVTLTKPVQPPTWWASVLLSLWLAGVRVGAWLEELWDLYDAGDNLISAALMSLLTKL